MHKHTLHAITGQQVYIRAMAWFRRKSREWSCITRAHVCGTLAWEDLFHSMTTCLDFVPLYPSVLAMPKNNRSRHVLKIEPSKTQQGVWSELKFVPGIS
jgi:hypothetical protein